ncbi:hypothetical protein ACFPU1_16820 [Thalassorhabdus alkalitolerans]|uniref:Secreted protein n=1 Tax=Thalassorhabdus alkalitolerans TaxID=2282697 RepID=A0ABW0YRK3_9BACI
MSNKVMFHRGMFTGERRGISFHVFFLLCFSFNVVATGCGNDELNQSSTNEEIGNPTPEEILDSNPEADIFEYQGIV